MTKKIFGGIAVLAIAAVAALNINLTANQGDFSDLSLSQVEALALQEYQLTPSKCLADTIYTDSIAQVILPQSAYKNDMNCSFGIQVNNPDKQFLKITVNCNTEAGFDFVTISSVDSTSAWNILATELCVSGSRATSVIVSVPNGRALVNFKTDASGCGTDGYGGFTVTWTLSNYAIPDLYTNNGYFSGSVGIGTQVLSQKLNVIGDSYFNGKIGIGISNPQSALHINGSAYLPAGQSYRIGSYNDSGNRLRLHHAGFSGNANIDYLPNLHFRADGTTDVMTLLQNGNVGVGTTDPVGLLEVYKSSHPTFVLKSPASRLEIGIGDQPGDFCSWSKQSDVTFRTMSGGNSMNFCIPNNNNDGNSYIKFGDAANGGWIGIFNNRIMRINGTVIAKDVFVRSDVWSDFVFSPDYQLPSLHTVSNYIQEKKHLPDIPTESEVKANGINVGEMQAKLLQKIEELTLYLIQQQATIEELKAAITKLQTP